MSFLNIILLTLLMCWSWAVSQMPNEIAQSTHVQIQRDLKSLIKGYIQKQLPQASNIKFHKFWTESINKNNVKASFSYSFSDESEKVGESTTGIEGAALLVKNKDSWDLEQLNVTNNTLEFKKPLSITPNKLSDESN